jgi:hypothetical protein
MSFIIFVFRKRPHKDLEETMVKLWSLIWDYLGADITVVGHCMAIFPSKLTTDKAFYWLFYTDMMAMQYFQNYYPVMIEKSQLLFTMPTIDWLSSHICGILHPN